MAPFSDKLSPHGGKMAATTSAYTLSGSSPAGKNATYISMDPAQTGELNVTA